MAGTVTGYHAVHLPEDASRATVWKVIAEHLSWCVPPTAHVVEIGAGYCDWINNVSAARRVAVDVWPEMERFAAGGVQPFTIDASTELRMLGESTFDVVLASNVLEHFTPDVAAAVVGDVAALLKPGGRFVIIQPNFRYAWRRYFDDYTHRSVFTDVSLPALLRSHGFAIDAVEPRFLPVLDARHAHADSPLDRARLSAIADQADGGTDARDCAEGLTVVWKSKTVSIVLPAYNEEKYIRPAVEDFFLPGIVDEVVVVDNNSRDRTAEEAAATRARVVRETVQGYGHALRRGLREATGDLVIMAEPDGTFVGRDVMKLLAYADDFEMVCGTRTTRELIWEQANMGWFLRVGNWAVAKLIQVLFGGPSLTDCGCTLRLTHRTALARIQDDLTVGGSHFLPEMVIAGLKRGVRIIEVPVNYRGRIGESKITGTLPGTLRTGFRMIALILRCRLT